MDTRTKVLETAKKDAARLAEKNPHIVDLCKKLDLRIDVDEYLKK